MGGDNDCGVHGRQAVAGRSSLEALWARQRSLLARLAQAIAHDLNNSLASVQTNAFLLKDSVSGEDAEALQGIEAAVDFGIATGRSLDTLRTTSLADGPPLRLAAVGELVPPLLQELGRSDVHCDLHFAPQTVNLLVAGPLVREGFLTLTVLATELMPQGAEMSIDAAAAVDARGHRLSLRLSHAKVPPFMSDGGAEHDDAVSALPCVQLVRWLARHHGGDLLLTTPNPGGMVFDLFVPPDRSSSTLANGAR